MPDEIPDQVSRFIVDHFNSVAQLEALLLLRGDAGRSWCAEEAAQALYATPQTSEEQLADLCGRGLLSAERTPPATAALPLQKPASSRVAPAVMGFPARVDRG